MSPETTAGVVEVGSTDPEGAIHDIGYQHYSGPRLGRGYIRRSLFVESSRGAYGLGRAGRSKIMPMLLFAAMCLPAIVIVVATAVTGADGLLGNYPSYLVNLQLVVAIYVAGQAPASVSRDLRFGVMSLYFSRPMERIDYVVAKYAAMVTAITVLIATPLTILFVGALLAGLPLAEQIPDYARALGGALGAAFVLAGIGLVVAAMTPRRGLGVAAVIAVLLVLVGIQGAAQEVALAQGEEVLAGYLGMISPFTLADGIQSHLLGAESTLLLGSLGITGGIVFLLVAALITSLCFGGLVLRYRKVSVS
jgi:ABC-2 type transport system permease protein